jgi:hypothetical protein
VPPGLVPVERNSFEGPANAGPSLRPEECMRAVIRDLVAGMAPGDAAEWRTCGSRSKLGRLRGSRSGVRRRRTPSHLVAYFVPITSSHTGAVVDHRKAGMWLPPRGRDGGGRNACGHSPPGKQPSWASGDRGTAPPATHRHRDSGLVSPTDVSLWCPLPMRERRASRPTEQFAAAGWFAWDALPGAGGDPISSASSAAERFTEADRHTTTARE